MRFTKTIEIIYLNRIKQLKSLLIILVVLSCSNGELKVQSIETGSGISRDGVITNKSLDFKFKKYSKNSNVQDLFNYLYFEGDTLSFSLTLNQKIDDKTVRGWFINPVTNEEFPIERIDAHGKKIWGFSLVGSLMENFFKKNLSEPIPANKYCCTGIKFTLKILITGNNNFKLEYKINNRFKILYI